MYNVKYTLLNFVYNLLYVFGRKGTKKLWKVQIYFKKKLQKVIFMQKITYKSFIDGFFSKKCQKVLRILKICSTFAAENNNYVLWELC